jgi:hypothetical protein
MDKIPAYSVDLIKELDTAYPNKHPNLDDSERMVWFKAGQRSVVNKLLQLLDEGAESGIPNLLE